MTQIRLGGRSSASAVAGLSPLANKSAPATRGAADKGLRMKVSGSLS
jgi:hypothetical protein